MNKDGKLLCDVFDDRKTHIYLMDLAIKLVKPRRECIQHPIGFVVIHKSGDFLEIENRYLRFFPKLQIVEMCPLIEAQRVGEVDEGGVG